MSYNEPGTNNRQGCLYSLGYFLTHPRALVLLPAYLLIGTLYADDPSALRKLREDFFPEL